VKELSFTQEMPTSFYHLKIYLQLRKREREKEREREKFCHAILDYNLDNGKSISKNIYAITENII